ncbi:hypothetical protein SpCBS45565_g03605 [Spizellomyces sp. 'palustris']|nr:hypothetical protein SpCBS45565_g03605 [Spizellomyces sp. 'palustris']
MDIDAALNIQPLSPPDSDGSSKSKARWRPQSGGFGIKTGGTRYGGSFDNLASPPEPRDSGPTIATIRRCASFKDAGGLPSDADFRGSEGPMDFPALIAHGSADLPRSATGSLPGSGTGLVSPNQTHPPVVRSRSSYSFQTMSNLLTIPNLLSNLRKTSIAPAPEPPKHDSGAPLKREARSRAGTAAPGDGQASEDDGFLKEIGTQGFAGIWNHPITRCYFLMFLLWREFENLYYFRMDAQQFRFDYPTLYSSARKSQAYRLYNTYLVKTAPMFILRRVPPEYQNVRKVIAAIKANIDNHDATLFDDLAFMVLNWLEEIYNGSFDASIDTAADGKKADTICSADSFAPSFRASAFYQAMRNDLRGTRHLTTIQYNRAAERITDMPSAVYDGNEVWEKLMTSLEAMGVDCEVFRVRGSGVIVRKSSQKGSSSASRTRSMSSLDSRKSTNAPDTADDGSSSPSKDWKRNSNNQLNVAYGSGDLPHTFVQYTNGDQQFCEHCCRKVAKGSEDASSAYRCESCRYMCHKNCRNAIRVSCVKPSNTLEVEDQSEVLSEKMKRVTEKMQAVQREVDIEMKIRDGLDNLLRAKGSLGAKQSSSKKPVPMEMDSQMERSNKKLDVLKHELTRCRLQLAALAAAAAAAANNPSLVETKAEEGVRPAEHKRTSSSASTVLDLSKEGEVVKVVTMDSAMKAESTKTFYITSETTVKQLIRMALEKFVMPGNDEDYILSYTSRDGDDVPLRHEDCPSKLGLNLLETPFRLKVNIDTATLYEHPKRGASAMRQPTMSKEDETRQRKQRDVLMEIIETEINYTDDLRNIVGIFYRPLSVAGVLNLESENDVFSNVKTILEIHDELSTTLIDKRDEMLHNHVSCTSALLPNITSLFAKRLDAFTAYETYCSNQHNARRKLARLKQDLMFTKMLTQCEANPKLNKLNLADLLVKPMHRITRYPILFKRLLSNTVKGSSEYETVNDFINGIEKKVADINEGVRRHEAAYRINLIDENLDFNNVVERFKLANGRRELISEKSFTYLKKNTNGTVEVVVLFFTDLVLIVRPKKADTFILFKPPIPLEAAVFLDKPDAHGLKNVFQIIHLQQEIHSLQTISAYDKNAWLQEAETIRSRFCSIHYDFEHNILRDAADRYQEVEIPNETPLSADSVPSSVLSNSLKSSPTAARRRNTSVPATSKESKRERQSQDAGDMRRKENVTRTQTTDGDIKRTPSWAHMLKGKSTDSLRRSAMNAEQAELVNDDPVTLPTKALSDDAFGGMDCSEWTDDTMSTVGTSSKTSSFFRRGSNSSRTSSNSKSLNSLRVKSELSLSKISPEKEKKEERAVGKSDDNLSKSSNKKKKKKRKGSLTVKKPDTVDVTPQSTPPVPLEAVSSPLDVSTINNVEASRAATYPTQATSVSSPITPTTPINKINKRSSWNQGGRPWWTWSKQSSKNMATDAGEAQNDQGVS